MLKQTVTCVFILTMPAQHPPTTRKQDMSA